MYRNLLLFTCLIFTVNIGYTQIETIPVPQLSPLEKIETQVGISEISIEYSRPSMRGRKIFGELVPYNQVWRTGANINTRITFSKPVRIGNKVVQEGVYTIFTIPAPDEWEVIFHVENEEYGAPNAIKEENIIARISVPVDQPSRSIETLSFRFEDLRMDGCNLVLAWENLLIRIPLNIPTSAIMKSSLETTLDQTADNYAFAASNFLNIDSDAEAALKAINFALSLKEHDMNFVEWLTRVDPKDWSAPWYYQLKSEIHGKLGQYDQAINAAKRSLEICEKLEDAEFSIKKNRENIARWEK